jgi:hypothetical protein
MGLAVITVNVGVSTCRDYARYGDAVCGDGGAQLQLALLLKCDEASPTSRLFYKSMLAMPCSC